ncbi:hypothetical protein Adt_16374 [Abeliophyllum distichum]|uniref:Uncharacterized protein n=1 Tax=Abeliophyllum distichum TaxID=126358 RepID=A0ABD1TDI3_9LAMI
MGLNRGGVNPLTWKTPVNRKSFFDFGDISLEPKQTVSIYDEIDKRLKMRGIDEPSKDLETLKQILEALQLKGLLHFEKPYRNFVYDQSPMVVVKPSRTIYQEMVIRLLIIEIKYEEFAEILTSLVKVQRR